MLTWWRHLSRVGKFASIVVPITSAIVGMAAAWPIVEPGVPVLHFQMRDYVPREIDAKAKPLQTAQAEQTQAIYGLQIDNAERDCEKVADEIIVMSALLPREPDDILRQRKTFQLEQKKQRYHDIDSKLKGWRSGRGCPYSTGQ